MTAIRNKRLEQLIRRSPADWFWLHNRWKPLKPEFLLANAKRGVTLPPDVRMEDLQRFEIVIRSPDSLSEACHGFDAAAFVPPPHRKRDEEKERAEEHAFDGIADA